MKWAFVIFMTVMLSFSGFTDHEEDSNRLGHKKHELTPTSWRKIGRDSDGVVNSAAMGVAKTDGTWYARGRVKSEVNDIAGRWSMITGGPDVYDDHDLHDYSGKITRYRRSDGDIGQDADPRNLVENTFSLIGISGQEGSQGPWLLSEANVPW